MEQINHLILTVNGGSSSIKFSLYNKGNVTLRLIVAGAIENTGTKNAEFHFTYADSKQQNAESLTIDDQNKAAAFLIEWLKKQNNFDQIKAIGHRIVHGMKHTEPELVTPELLDELKEISQFDPDHLPAEIKLIELFEKHFPSVNQVACFDTSFHTTMPPVAKQLALPERLTTKGIQRYGFHGLSYAFLLQELKRIAGDKVANGKVILAHLGSGASIAAVKNGKSIDTSMGFTPASGIPMSTRSGDIDPGVAWYIMKSENSSAGQFNKLVNHESGLLGVSGTSASMQELLKTQHTDNRAAMAVELFCYQTKKWIGSYVAALGGIDTLIFAGGIGEKAAEIRSRICNGLQFLGIELDEEKNRNNEAVISKTNDRVRVHVMKTNEELMIAELVCKILHY